MRLCRLMLEIWRRRRLREGEREREGLSFGDSVTSASALAMGIGSTIWLIVGGVRGPRDELETVDPERARTWAVVFSRGFNSSCGVSVAGSWVTSASAGLGASAIEAGSSTLGAEESASWTASELGLVEEPSPDLRDWNGKMLDRLVVVEGDAESRVAERVGVWRPLVLGDVVGDAGRGDVSVKARVGERKDLRRAKPDSGRGGVEGADMVGDVQ